MKKKLLFLMIYCLLVTVSCSASECKKVSNKFIDESFGVQIHFTEGHQKDLDLIKKAGFRRVRMDFFWTKVEKEKGHYDFSEYDALLTELKKRGLKPIFELDFGNPIYGENWSVRKSQTRKAFSNFAAAAAKHYHNEDIIWEIWNEPNIEKFWYPKPNALEYMLLVKEAATAIKSNNAHAFIVAPALSEMRFTYIEECMKLGLLNYIDAITVHPYRQDAPETIENDLARLKDLTHKYAKNKNIQIIAGEWGYPSKTSGSNERLQAEYLTRMFLYNAYLNIPITIWYDWKDDGVDSQEIEHNFGLIYFNGALKPSYRAMSRLSFYLDGKVSMKRLASDPKDYILLLTGNGNKTYAVWTSGENHTINLEGIDIELNSMPTFINVK